MHSAADLDPACFVDCDTARRCMYDTGYVRSFVRSFVGSRRDLFCFVFFWFPFPGPVSTATLFLFFLVIIRHFDWTRGKLEMRNEVVSYRRGGYCCCMVLVSCLFRACLLSCIVFVFVFVFCLVCTRFFIVFGRPCIGGVFRPSARRAAKICFCFVLFFLRRFLFCFGLCVFGRPGPPRSARGSTNAM